MFELSEQDKNFLKEIKIDKIYLRFFDVDYDERSGKIVPVAKVGINTHDFNIIPVVYITQDALKHIDRDKTHDH